MVNSLKKSSPYTLKKVLTKTARLFTLSPLTHASTPQRLFQLWGTVTEVAPGMIKVSGVSEFAGVGNEIRIDKPEGVVSGEVLTISGDSLTALLFSPCDSIRIGDAVEIEPEATVSPSDHWLGQVVNYRGEIIGDHAARAPMHTRERRLNTAPLPPHSRRPLGSRLSSGLMLTDTLLPICQGQRVGLFAGSGVGKSTLLGALAGGIAADRVVIGLIGERSREVNEFVRSILPASALPRTVVVAATASEPAGAKKRAAYCAMAAAEHFRDEGHNVLFLLDSITRFAEAHRETALLAGETPALNAFPPSTVRVIAELAERAGPGAGSSGDISAIYSVLVAGSDHEEPVADMIRGILDGHIVMSRKIAERGRYPAIDILKSVSRSLPHAASPEENQLLQEYRRLLALYEEVAPMLRANLYEFGRDLATDRAIALFPALDGFASARSEGGISGAFEALNALLNSDPNASADQAEEEVLTGGSAETGAEQRQSV